MGNLQASLRYWLATSGVALAVGCSSGDSPAHQAAKTPVKVSATSIESISIERFGHGPQTPWYKVTLRRDGSVTYVGSFNVARIGNYQAKISTEDFRRLAELVERSGFFSLEDSYPFAVDAPEIKITIEAGGRTKTIHDGWGSRTPVELWGLEMAIDGVVAGLDGWTKSE